MQVNNYIIIFNEIIKYYVQVNKTYKYNVVIAGILIHGFQSPNTNCKEVLDVRHDIYFEAIYWFLNILTIRDD